MLVHLNTCSKILAREKKKRFITYPLLKVPCILPDDAQILHSCSTFFPIHQLLLDKFSMYAPIFYKEDKSANVNKWIAAAKNFVSQINKHKTKYWLQPQKTQTNKTGNTT